MIIDLHAHSCASDGDFAPTELIAHAAQHRIDVLALTDHDTVDGIAEAQAAASFHGIELIPGIEVSTGLKGSDVHMLGLFIDPEHSAMTELLSELRDTRVSRVEGIVSRLRTMGVDVTMTEVLEEAGAGSVGRPHIARVMVRKQIVNHHVTAFRKYLGHGALAWTPTKRVSPRRVVETIHACGGVSIVAHPVTIGDDALVEELLDIGADGVEVYYPEHGGTERQRYKEMVVRRGVLLSGGTDFHGVDRNPRCQFGKVSLPGDALEAIRSQHVERIATT